MPPLTSTNELAVSRVTHRLQQVTDQLIQALFAQSRDPSPGRVLRIADLETKRDELHDRLTDLERWALPAERSSGSGSSAEASQAEEQQRRSSAASA